MEQSNGISKVCEYVPSLNEWEVADILVGMERAILGMDSDLRVPFQWGRKRKRSAINVPRFSFSPPATTVAPKAAFINGGGEGGVVVVPAKVKPEAEASSPATPLSLSLTESEEKPLRTKASLKRKREHYLKVVEDLTKSKAALNQEIDNVKSYYEKLKAFNLKLKERKKELSNCSESECKKNPSLEIGCQMLQQQQQQQQLVNAKVNPSNSMAQTNQQHHHHQKFQFQLQQQHFLRMKLNQTSGPSQFCSTSSNEGNAQFQHVSMPPLPSSSSSSASLTMVNTISSNMGPIGVPDLNVSPEELIHVDSFQPLDVNVTIANKDVSRAMAAKARQRRIQIHRLKNPVPNSKPRYSCR